MSRISTEAPITTLINVFTVRPERQRALIDLLGRATEEAMRHLPGFVSANIHASTDGTKVTNYAQWRSAEDFHAMLGDPAAREHMELAAELAERYEPHLYTVESVHQR
ncbi:Antibiotic biosynthesis monooxygenase [Saccharopolyspora kobensis]|uniref:Antibiotic biosynthesis monooxygenase n=1 Tax=Saccharopolyspora kobensis TaxID=146035 RepID=A0A1H6E4B1_9PSEU|nr:antibiotic biosynthesis monooxygenase family protein [Saccharopolyspora kobensis]SEG92437.1 Antibiotic biosynthesis monooxygenase [Saccharopolyspora kobensis]SFD37839.1 Antibiotic biosynthesis monooxygenase [Saccharopolyspora kobensis]